MKRVENYRKEWGNTNGINITNKNENSLLFKHTEATGHSFNLNAPKVLA